MRRRIVWFLACVLPFAPGSVRAAEEMPVDVELVLAVDASWSMDSGEQRIQRDGYVAAFRSAEVQEAILGGGHQKVAVTYVEWAGEFSQSVIVPWTLIDSKASAEAFAYRLSEEEPERARRTSISSAIDVAAPMFDANGFKGLRRVIDVSGDGPNNQGRLVTEARDAAARRGITINGLPLMTSGASEGAASWGSIPHLDRYYATCVIGGPGAFMIPVNDWAQFPEAVRRKLVMELAGGWPLPKVEDGERPVRIAADADAVDCLIGERQWQDRQFRWPTDR
ncbi:MULTISPECIES: DUF1194 domain-containing protein [unclassified Aureimonas]|uniref:DUF1194 domain-containing protein n=1 Tax=unclassified Aureimonas TaxID=2615206 RepID=UPI0006F1E295|nr:MULTISPECIES: DUF1194 domain-containing protein [unclassified Aureimonas]KQT57309.1 hypothetical protein ASG62_08140 [Aureimonas sp. Leaf427]KQT76989.1 hypothetical protein ASG54_12005 [Aureimonas sp. Leaf460]